MLLSVVNKVEVERQKKLNRYFFWAGILGLLGSMAVLIVSAGDANLAPLVFLLGYPFLILGLILSKRGAFSNRRHGVGGYQLKSEPETIVTTLEGMPSRYHLYHWVRLDNNIKIEHMIVNPMGVLILAVKPHLGDIRATHDRYRRRLGVTGWFQVLGEPGLGNPSKELADLVKATREWFEQKGYEIPVDGIVVFSNPRGKIVTAEEMSFPVCHMHDLKAAVKGWETELNMSVPEQQEVEEHILQALPASVAEEARALAQMPGFKRATYLAAQKEKGKAADKKAAKKVAPEKKIEPATPKPKLTPEEREALRQQRIKEQQEKGRVGQNPQMQAMMEPGKKIGLDGKLRDKEPAVIEKKLPKRDVAPLKRPNPGAFGRKDD